MSDESTWTRVQEEMQKDGLDLLEQVLALITGGVLGGNALRLADANLPILYELGAYAGLFAIGFFVLGTTHFVVSYNRVLSADTEDED
ncbi:MULTISPECIES: hypothetical protein [Haloferacaceae]|uniref:Uncharacterized protein n=1 Tax=Halorubrum glutamatedens TaxID=2707018 RepID=A0ABD5QPC7_9EURY|nr:hypothetical protein [Halobellus captivus]